MRQTKTGQRQEQHLLSAGPLLNEKGRLAEAGYATKTVRTYHRADVRAGKSRIKEWDYYLIQNDRFGVALTLDDNGYMGLVSASFLDFEAAGGKTGTRMFWFPMGKVCLPESPDRGGAAWTGKNYAISLQNDGSVRRIHCRMAKLDGKRDFSADLELTDFPADSMVIATPFAEKRTAFYYNQKTLCMRARGSVTLGDRTVHFDPAESFGLLDWGRGVWTYANTWLWSAAQGIVGGKRFGFNLGDGFGDTKNATENMAFVDGRAEKLGRITFEIPKAEKGRDDYLKPWRFTSDDGRFEADFQPVFDRAFRTNALVLLSDQHQVFGRFTGTIRLADGQTVSFQNLTGFAEKVKNRW